MPRGSKSPEQAGKPFQNPVHFTETLDDLITSGVVKALEHGLPRPDWEALIFGDVEEF